MSATNFRMNTSMGIRSGAFGGTQKDQGSNQQAGP